MSVSNPWFDKRLKALLPPKTPLIHTTGSSRTYEELTPASNDVSIIRLPSRDSLIVSVFLKDSFDPAWKRDKTIATVAKLAYDHWQ